MPSKKDSTKNDKKNNKQKGQQEITNKRQALSQLKRMDWDLEFKTDHQEDFYNEMIDHDITFAIGPAGTGKTHLSIHYALEQLAEKNNHIDGIILCRPLITIDHEPIGFLPGSIAEKTDPYMAAYFQIIEKIMGRDKLEVLKNAGVIEVLPTAFLRGMTLENKIVIYDEAQNSTTSSMKSFLTRIGDNSKMIILGDLMQTDRKGMSGLEDAIARLSDLEEVGFTEFMREDIVRHGLISKILERYEKPVAEIL
jgi:phosphate starvation-inducible PhoH-like protein